ncbi:MAG: flippase [Chitinophagales bacterium]
MNLFTKIRSLIFGPGQKSRYVRNTGWLLGARGIQMLFAFIIGAMVARYLGPEKYGIYNYVISFVGVFSALSSLGIGTIMVRDMLHKEASEDVLLGTSLLLRLGGSIVATACILITGMFTEDQQAVRFFLFLASLQPIVRSIEVIAFYFQAQVRSKFTVIAQLISLGIISLLKIIFITQHFSLVWFMYLLALDSAITGISMIYFYRKLGKRIFTWYFDKGIAKGLLKESWPLIFSGMFTTIYLKIDQVILGNLMDDASVGLYAAAVKISEAWITIPWIISGSMYPALVNSYKSNKEIFRIRISQLYVILIGIALLVIIPIALFAPFIIRFIFTDVYADSANVLRVHICSSLFIFLGSLSNRWLILEKTQKFWMLNSALGAVLNILLNFIMIPSMGIMGAAYATLISYALAYHFAYYLNPKTRMIFYEQNRSFLRTVFIFPALSILRKPTAASEQITETEDMPDEDGSVL